MADEISKNLWDDEQVAAFLGVSPVTVRNWVKRGQIPFRKAGSLNRFDPDEIEAWTKRQREPEEIAS